MPTFILQVQTTLDGYMAGPDGQMDWMTMPWSDDVGEYIGGVMGPVDRLVLGRRLAEGFIPHWAAGPEGEPQESIDFMNRTPKTVITRTLTASPWPNATVANEPAAAVDAMKGAGGGDILAYGGATLVASLIEQRLLDELHLFVNPVAIGAGKPVFPTTARTDFERVAVTPFACGITAVHLARA
ncbi:MAG: dihydrofolate reductase [Thermoleophilia bacterium]|nr:dihydrofolate reductase [Thermoleophilia bacterium]